MTAAEVLCVVVAVAIAIVARLDYRPRRRDRTVMNPRLAAAPVVLYVVAAVAIAIVGILTALLG